MIGIPFNGKDTKPKEPGVYETDIKWYAYWTGKKWSVSYGTVEKAERMKHNISPLQTKYWRKLED